MSFNKKPNIKEIRKKGERPNKKHVNPDDNIKSKHSNNKQSKHAISFPNGYNLHEGDKILSVVSEITDGRIHFSLPFRMKFVTSVDNMPFVRIGDIVPLSVLSPTTKNHRLECTCDVNTVNTVRGIKVGDVLYGVVSSMEDYGYIVNVANSVDVFVNSKNSVLSDESDESSKMEEDSQEESNESSNSSKEMEESSEESSSNEEMSESKEDESEEDDDDNNNNNNEEEEEEESSEEMSGSESSEEPTTLKTVKKIKVGAFVQIQITEEIGGKYKGIEASTSTIVEQSTNVRIGCHVHITDEEFTQNGYIVKFCGLRGYCHDFHHSTQNNEAVIVYYDSQTHKYHLSMLPHVICEDFELQSPLPIYSLTDFTVKQIDRHVGIIGSVSDSNVFLPVKQINDEIVKFVPELYTKNSTHKARVMFYSAFDGLCGITTRASILDSNFQTIYDIKPAMHVTGTIKEITKDGVIVKFGEKVFGFCDRKHSADIPIDDLSAVFKENQKCKFRVLSVNQKKNSYYLTHKRTLMNPNTTVISSVVDTPLNTIAHGVVVSVDTKRGVIVKFFNEVTGFIPTIELFNQSIENITVGQIIKTRVISFDKKSLLLSLNLYPEEGAVERFANLSNHFVVGQIYSGIVVAKRSKSLLVRLRHNEFQYISVLPNYLVLDNDSGEDIPKIIRNGTLLKECLLLTNSLGKLIITTKKSLINLSGKIPNVTERESIDSGKHIGYVSRITPRYAFITFYNNVSMRCMKYFVSDSNLPISDILSVGQTVCGYVNKKKQIILKQSSVGSISDEHLLLDVTTSTTPEIGSVVKFAINDIKSFGIVGKIKALDMTAFMPVAGVSGHLKDYNNANTTTAVIVAVDEEKGVVDCISEKLVKAKKLVTGSVHTSKVVLNREHYCIALVDGCIVYVNKKRMNGGHYQVEDTVDIIVCEQIEKLNNVYRGTVRYIPTSFNVTNNHIVIGSTVTGVVSFSTETVSYIKLGNRVNGRLHIANSKETTKLGDEITAVVSGVIVNDNIITTPGEEITSNITMVELTTIDTPSLSKTLIDDECTTGYISKQLPNGYIISFNSFTFGLLPYTEIGSTLDEIEINKNEYHLGSSIKVIPHHNKEKVMLTLSKHSKPEVGDILAGVCGTYDYANQRLRVYLRGNQLVYLHVTDMCDVYHAFPLDTLTTGSMYNMAIIATTPTTYVSLRKEHLGGAYVDIFRPIVGGVISPLVTLETIHKDDVVMGYITSTDSSSGIDVTVGKDISVHVAVDDALDDNKYSADEFKKIFCLNRLVRLRINDVDEEQISGSLKQSVVYPGVVRFFKDAKVGMVVKCIVVGVTKDGVFLRFFNSILRGLCHSSMIEDKKLNLKELQKRFTLRQKVMAKVVHKDNKKKRINFSMKPADIGDVDVGDEDEHGIIDVWKLAIKKKIAKKKENLGIDTVVKENNNAEEEEEKVEEEFVMDVDKKPEVVWEDENFEDIKENEMEEEGEEEEEDEGEGEEEEDVDNQSSASEQPMEEEEEENEGVETYDLDECQRSVVAYPDNSLEWIKLMHCYIQAKNVTEARNTAHEALEKINFRKLDEKLNIWKALLQIESKHGDVKSLTKTYNEALEVCDRKKIMLHMAGIYKHTRDVTNEEKIFRTLLKKVKGSCKVYKKYCNFLMRTQREEELPLTIGKAKMHLDKKKIITLQLHMARLEYKYGGIDKGRAMFEDILNANPKRFDVWNVYIDMEQQVGDVNVIRRLFERIVKLKLSTKTMKTFLTKYLEFETNNGDEKRMDHVREIAKSFVDSK